MFNSNPDVNTGYPLEKTTAPVLIVSAVDDPLTLYVSAQAMAERIPGAELVTIERGGHMLLGHDEQVRSEIMAFLAGVFDEQGTWEGLMQRVFPTQSERGLPENPDYARGGNR